MNANLSAEIGKVVKGRSGGGSGWARTTIYETEKGQKVFAKVSGKGSEHMFRGEAAGLSAMGVTRTLRVPRVLGCDDLEGGGSFVAMEYFDLGGALDQFKLGEGLGRMHLARPEAQEALEGRFGFGLNNTIGGTPQPNSWSGGTGTEGWINFYAERRLLHQLELAGDPGLLRMGKALIERLPDFFDDVDQISPSIIHGDLWSGNIGGVAGDDTPAIFDPACYYAHHEAEFGMSWCANFGNEFWRGYRSVIPESQGFQRRKSLYQLYHYLNHYNLFGSGYYSQCSSILRNLTGS